MTPLKRFAMAVALPAAAASLAVPALAGAKAGDQTSQKTFPAASVLCARMAAGTERKALRPVAPKVLIDCAALQSEFTTAQTTVLAARAAIEPQIVAMRAAMTTACPTPKHQPALCSATRAKDDAAIIVLKHQERHASRAYFNAIETARTRFWHAVRSLPGLHRAKTDAPIDVNKSVQQNG